ncbi:MAG: ankyrin repeat domain-containing protein [Cyanobacteria bacterium P01_C01_bin.147]
MANGENWNPDQPHSTFFRFPLNIDLCALLAAEQGKTSILLRLLPLHPRMSFEDSNGRRGIHHAAQNGHVECACLLLGAGAAVNCSDKFGKTPLLIACAMGRVDVVK